LTTATKELSPGSLFELSLPIPSLPSPLICRLSLPPLFPQEDAPPLLSIVQPVILHPWVNHQGLVVGLESIQPGRWNPHVPLGRVLSDLVREFQARAPTLAPRRPSTATTTVTASGSPRSASTASPIQPPSSQSFHSSLSTKTYAPNQFLNFRSRKHTQIRETKQIRGTGAFSDGSRCL
jgi:hypothetical protein